MLCYGTGADLQALCSSAMMCAVRRVMPFPVDDISSCVPATSADGAATAVSTPQQDFEEASPTQVPEGDVEALEGQAIDAEHETQPAFTQSPQALATVDQTAMQQDEHESNWPQQASYTAEQTPQQARHDRHAEVEPASNSTIPAQEADLEEHSLQQPHLQQSTSSPLSSQQQQNAAPPTTGVFLGALQECIADMICKHQAAWPLGTASYDGSSSRLQPLLHGVELLHDEDAEMPTMDGEHTAGGDITERPPLMRGRFFSDGDLATSVLAHTDAGADAGPYADADADADMAGPGSKTVEVNGCTVVADGDESDQLQPSPQKHVDAKPNHHELEPCTTAEQSTAAAPSSSHAWVDSIEVLPADWWAALSQAPPPCSKREASCTLLPQGSQPLAAPLVPLLLPSIAAGVARLHACGVQLEQQVAVLTQQLSMPTLYRDQHMSTDASDSRAADTLASSSAAVLAGDERGAGRHSVSPGPSASRSGALVGDGKGTLSKLRTVLVDLGAIEPPPSRPLTDTTSPTQGACTPAEAVAQPAQAAAAAAQAEASSAGSRDDTQQTGSARRCADAAMCSSAAAAAAAAAPTAVAAPPFGKLPLSNCSSIRSVPCKILLSGDGAAGQEDVATLLLRLIHHADVHCVGLSLLTVRGHGDVVSGLMAVVQEAVARTAKGQPLVLYLPRIEVSVCGWSVYLHVGILYGSGVSC